MTIFPNQLFTIGIVVTADKGEIRHLETIGKQNLICEWIQSGMVLASFDLRCGRAQVMASNI